MVYSLHTRLFTQAYHRGCTLSSVSLCGACWLFSQMLLCIYSPPALPLWCVLRESASALSRYVMAGPCSVKEQVTTTSFTRVCPALYPGERVRGMSGGRRIVWVGGFPVDADAKGSCGGEVCVDLLSMVKVAVKMAL